MPRNIIKRFIPAPHKIKEYRSLQFLGDLIHDPNLWHINRQSVSRAFLFGVFCAFLPLPGQMIIVAALAIVFHANLALSIMLVWLSNPLTMALIYFSAYKLGALLLNEPALSFQFELSWHWIHHEAQQIWLPLLLGSVVCGLFFGITSSLTANWMWRRHVKNRWNKRRKARDYS